MPRGPPGRVSDPSSLHHKGPRWLMRTATHRSAAPAAKPHKSHLFMLQMTVSDGEDACV